MGTIFLNSFLLPLIIINQFVFHLPAVAAASDVLIPGDALTTLTSASGNFTLGFFTIKSTNLTYLGIWYTNNDARKVWVANRDLPMNSTGGVLMIDDETGTLKVVIKGSNNTNTTMFNVSNPQVLVDSTSSGGISTRAVLEDSGNLKLYDIANGNQTLWESFDYPTDTLLPGMKLGYNYRTGQNWTLTSWLSESIPASGDFTLKFEIFHSSPQLLVYRRGKLYWTSGPFEGYRIGIWIYQATFVSDALGVYIANMTDELGHVVPGLQLSSMGQLKNDGIKMFDKLLCYPSDKISDELPYFFGGCVYDSPAGSPSCSTKYMSIVSSKDYLLTGLIRDDNSSNISLSDCMLTCWNDCKCIGFSSSNINGTGCRIWAGNSLLNRTWDGFSSDIDGLMDVGISNLFEPPEVEYLCVYAARTWRGKDWKWVIIFATIVLTCAYIVYRSAPYWYVKIRRRIIEGFCWIMEAR